MAFKKKASRKVWRRVPVALKVLALCVIALVALLLILPAPPERDAGGVTRVGKYVPRLRDTVDPLARSPLPEGVEPPAMETPAEPPVQTPPPEPVQPDIANAPEMAPERSDPPPDPLRKPENEEPPAAPAAEASEGTSETALPWNQEQDLAGIAPDPLPPDTEEAQPAGLPSKADIRDWLRSQAWEFLGGVDSQGNILYRFEVWLEAPPEVLKSIKSVSYEYDAPSATPNSRDTDEPKGGFRARFGSLACSKNVTITITMADGKTRQTTADGCRALN